MSNARAGSSRFTVAREARSNFASSLPSFVHTAAVTMLSLTVSARSVSVAALLSPNATAAVLLEPMTSASMPVSRTSRVRALERSQASTAVIAMRSDMTLVRTPRKVSFRASESLACQATIRGSQGLWLVMAIVSENFRELQEPGAEAHAGALRRVRVDGEPHATLFDEEADDAAEADEVVSVADREDWRSEQFVEDGGRAAG